MHPNTQPSRNTHHGHPSLAWDESGMPSFIVAHGSDLSPIGDKVGAASGPPDMVTPRDRGCLRDAAHGR